MNNNKTRQKQSFRHKQTLIFCVTSILPLLLFCYVLVDSDMMKDPGTMILFGSSVTITLLGFLYTMRIVRQFGLLAEEIKKMENGESVELVEPDMAIEFSEMMQISNAFNKTLIELKAHTRELEGLVEKINTLSEVTELVSRIPDIDEVLRVVLKRTMRSVNARIGSIMLVDEGTEMLRIVASEGLDDSVVANTNIRLGEKIAGKVAQTGESILVDDIEADPRFQKSSDPKYEGTSFLSMPLRAHHRVMGALNLSKKSDHKAFSDADLKFLRTLLGHIGFALENARLLKDAQVAAEKLQKVVQERSVQLGEMEQKALQSVTLFHEAQKREAISNLASGLAHDFNNLLMGIQGNLSMLLFDTDTAHPHHERLISMEQYVESGAEISRQLMGFVRKSDFDPKPLDLNAVVKSTSEMFGRTDRGVEVDSEEQEDIWAVKADKGQMEQVLLNLYVNARQAMHDGGTLRLRTENVILDEDFVRPYKIDPGSYVNITVGDTGDGMDEETLGRIFEPFFTTKEIGRGTGLGLASANGIIKNHGGIITVESQKGEGTTFDIYLPVTEKELIEADTGNGEKILMGQENILLIDDEEMILKVSGEMIEKMGYKVTTAESGQEAIRIYEEKTDSIALVILDMIMPTMGGGEIFERLKGINPDVKVLLTSGYTLDGQVSFILERGCNGFIQKPFKPARLSQEIRQILGNDPADLGK